MRRMTLIYFPQSVRKHRKLDLFYLTIFLSCLLSKLDASIQKLNILKYTEDEGELLLSIADATHRNQLVCPLWGPLWAGHSAANGHLCFLVCVFIHQPLQGSSLVKGHLTGSLLEVPAPFTVLSLCSLWADSCVDIPDIPDAYWDSYRRPRKGELYSPGTVFKYSCHSGYVPATHESTTVTCQSDFKWSPFRGCKSEFLFLKYLCIFNALYVAGLSTLNLYKFIPQGKFKVQCFRWIVNSCHQKGPSETWSFRAKKSWPFHRPV